MPLPVFLEPHREEARPVIERLPSVTSGCAPELDYLGHRVPDLYRESGCLCEIATAVFLGVPGHRLHFGLDRTTRLPDAVVGIEGCKDTW